MNRGHDSNSDITVALGQKPKSQAKLAQLESARKLALESRRVKQRERLEAKLAQLRSLGDVSNAHLERVCMILLDSEKEGRKRTNIMVEDINTNIEDLMQEISTIRKMLERMKMGSRSTPSYDPRPQTQTQRSPQRQYSPGRQRRKSDQSSTVSSSHSIRLVS
eukprot:2283309-Prymnesium_polylepis.1